MIVKVQTEMMKHFPADSAVCLRILYVKLTLYNRLPIDLFMPLDGTELS
jgi:hypothetical protein